MTHAHSQPNAELSGVEAEVWKSVQDRIRTSPYAHYFNRITWRFESGKLRLQGCVPTFYLKQVLLTLVRNVDHVEHIANEVNVVNSSGLSSEADR